MNKTSIEKLQKAGYIFLRERDIPGKCGRVNYAIMQSKKFGTWSILEKFETKAARKRRIDDLSKENNILIDAAL